MSNTQQQIEFPVAAVEKLCTAVNEANDAFRAHAQALGVDLKGASYFGITENKEIRSAILEKHKQFFEDDLTALLLATIPGAGGKLH